MQAVHFETWHKKKQKIVAIFKPFTFAFSIIFYLFDKVQYDFITTKLVFSDRKAKFPNIVASKLSIRDKFEHI